MTFINSIFSTTIFFLSYTLFCGDFFEPGQNSDLWGEDADWANPEFDQDSIKSDNCSDVSGDSDSETGSETYRFKNIFNILYEEPEEEIFNAIFNHDLEKVSLLIENRENLDVMSEDIQLTPLFYAVNFGTAEIIKLLLENGADCYEPGYKCASVAHYSIAKKNVVALAVILEHSKEFYSKLDHDGSTLLHSAVVNGNHSLLNVVLDYSQENGKNYINFSQKDKFGNNVFFLIAENKHSDFFAIIIDHFYKEIDCDDLVRDGQSIFHVIFGKINETLHYWCPSLEQIKPLVEHFYELLNYTDKKNHLTALDIIHKKRDESLYKHTKNNFFLIDKLAGLIRENGGKTAQEVNSFNIKSGASHN